MTINSYFMKSLKFLSALLGIALAVNVFQACSDDTSEESTKPYLTVSPAAFTPDAGVQTLYATVTSNKEVSIGSRPDWCGVELLSGEKTDNLRINVEANPDDRERTAVIVLSASGCKDAEVRVTQAAAGRSGACELLTFRIEGYRNGLENDVLFDFDTKNRHLKAMYLKWINRDDPAMMIPTFTVNGKQVLVNDIPVVSNETKISFADEVSLVVVAENGDSETYTLSLNCPQINTELPVLRMQPDAPITGKDSYVPTSIELYSPSTSEGWWNSETDGKIEMRGRGNSTWVLPKKPYRMKFPAKFSPIGLDHAKAKSWVILAHDMDKSLLRNHLAFELSRVLFNAAEGYHDSSAVMFTPCSQYVNVYMDDTYHGLYQMSDQMEQAEGRIAVEKLTDKDGADPEKITGGHIIETDIHEAYPPERFSSSRGIQMNHKYPKDDECDPAQYQYIENFIRTAEAVLYGNDFKEPVNGWRKYFDEKTLADFIIVKEFAGDMDGYTSTYMYKRRGVDKIFFGPIWDCDKGWDNDKRVPHSSYQPLSSLMMFAGFYMPSNIYPDWFHRFWQDETFRTFVAARWAAKKAQLTATIRKELDEKTVGMAKAIEANYTVWPFYYQASDEAKMPAETYEKEIERIRTLTDSRAELLDGLFK